jgi:hypothetical protein
VAARRSRPQRDNPRGPRYKNGVLGLTSSYPLTPGTSTYAVNIGRNPGGTTRFRGRIDEVRIYDRVLSAAEVQALFAEGG